MYLMSLRYSTEDDLLSPEGGRDLKGERSNFGGFIGNLVGEVGQHHPLGRSSRSHGGRGVQLPSSLTLLSSPLTFPVPVLSEGLARKSQVLVIMLSRKSVLGMVLVIWKIMVKMSKMRSGLSFRVSGLRKLVTKTTA